MCLYIFIGVTVCDFMVLLPRIMNYLMPVSAMGILHSSS